MCTEYVLIVIRHPVIRVPKFTTWYKLITVCLLVA